MKYRSCLILFGLLFSSNACGPPGSMPPTPTRNPLPSTPVFPPQSATSVVPSEQADIILTSGKILTMDNANPNAEALAIRGDKILVVGRNADVLASRNDNTIVIDLEGLTVTPGFIDSHTHRITQRYKWGFSTVEQAAQEAIAQGWTGLDELAVDEGQFNELREAASLGQLHIRVNAYLIANTFEGQPLNDWYNVYKSGQKFGPYLRIAGLKVFIDGNSGRILYWGPDELTEFLRQRQAEGWQIAIKAIGIQSHELALSAYESMLQGQNNEAYRYRLEHSLAVNSDQLSRMARMGIIASIQPSFPSVIWHEPDIHTLVDEQGMENIFRWREYQDSGVFMAASPYNPDGVNNEFTLPSHVSPMGLLYRSVTQIGLGDRQPESWMLKKSLTVEEILPQLTSQGAYATFEEDVKGNLAAGKLADLVILSDNPLDVQPEQLKDIRVLMTMIGGKVEYCVAGYEALCLIPSVANSSSPTPVSVSSPQAASYDSVIASSELPGEPATNAFDGSLETLWNSGYGPEQWIQIDWGETRTISSIRLTVAQYPEGETIHQIWAGDAESNLQLLHQFKGPTSDSQVLEFNPLTPIQHVRFIRIVTTQSPSWVAWREVEVISPK